MSKHTYLYKSIYQELSNMFDQEYFIDNFDYDISAAEKVFYDILITICFTISDIMIPTSLLKSHHCVWQPACFHNTSE